MRLREHPLLAYHRYSTWPPIWVGVRVTGPSPAGETGILREVRRYTDKPCRLFLTMEEGGEQYVGCLLFDNEVCCERILEVLERRYGMHLKDIGDLDVPLPLDLLLTYRKAPDGETWHCCTNCSHWPHGDYLEEMMLPAIVPLCNECKSLEASGRCARN